MLMDRLEDILEGLEELARRTEPTHAPLRWSTDDSRSTMQKEMLDNFVKMVAKVEITHMMNEGREKRERRSRKDRQKDE